MDPAAAQRRLGAISGHLCSSPASNRDEQLNANSTAGEFVHGMETFFPVFFNWVQLISGEDSLAHWSV